MALILVASCHSRSSIQTTYQQPVKDCRIVQHSMGSICIPRNPQRVVTLDSFENSWALGIRPIASSYVTGFPMPKYLQGKVELVESVGAYNSPNIEKILRLKPDLIIVRSDLEGIYKNLSYIAPTVVLNIPFPPPPWQDTLKELATVLGKEKEGQQLLNQYWQRVEKLQQTLSDSAASPKENFLKNLKVSIANTSSEYGVWSYGEKHYSGSILKDIGLQRPKSQRGDFFYVDNISKEKISDIDGDVLLFASWERKDDKKTLDKLKRNPLWSQLEAVQKNKVYLVGAHWHNSDIFAINAILDDLEKYLVNEQY
ncbi:MAG: iron-siderophore ABC transporter substrate-binding protein [Thermosynechococcaceae cyanobacterium MS004]|nr:iron-siderophore ABC transporter substrate-binding protein [Thermosynechococcaceae cyanobacterium MS004]